MQGVETMPQMERKMWRKTLSEVLCLKARANTAEKAPSLTEEPTLSDPSLETGRVSLMMEDGSVLTDVARLQNSQVL